MSSGLFLSKNVRVFEYYRSLVIASCFSCDSIKANPPWLLEGIEKCLQASDVRDRCAGWDALATEQQEKSRAFWERWRDDQAESVDL